MTHAFGLVLVVDHACNLRCTYCYTGAKAHRPMPEALGRHAIGRALATLDAGDALELGFFGGEPLLQAGLVRRLLAHARYAAEARGITLQASLTTNGTVNGPDATALLLDRGLDIAISHDGIRHDLDRLDVHGRPTAALVDETIDRLIEAGREVRVVTVVGPKGLGRLGDTLVLLRERGVARVDLSIDLWTRWTDADAWNLRAAVHDAAEVWRESFPHFGVSWFDAKLARLARLVHEGTARCGFGRTEVAVAPSGRMYPCERVVGEDPEEHPLRLPGHVTDGADFHAFVTAAPSSHERTAEACTPCALQPMCGTSCRCSNWVRTGDPSRPDGLLCLLEKLCAREAALALTDLARRAAGAPNAEAHA